MFNELIKKTSSELSAAAALATRSGTVPSVRLLYKQSHPSITQFKLIQRVLRGKT